MTASTVAKAEHASRNRVIGWAVTLFIISFVLYLATFSPNGTGDGPTWLMSAMNDDLVRMFPLQHIFHTFVLYLYLKLVTIGSSIPLAELDYFDLMQKAQIPFAAVAAAGISTFFLIVYRITRQLSTAIIAGLLLMFSSGYWLNANMETKNYTVLLWMLTFAISMEYRPGNYRHLIGIGLIGALTTMAEIDAGIAAFVVTYFIIAKNRKHPVAAVKEVAFVGFIWAALIAVVVLSIGLFMPSWEEWIFEISTGSEFVNFMSMRANFRQFVSNPLMGLALSLAVGQSDAFVTGFMVPKRIFQDQIYMPIDWLWLAMYVAVVCMTVFGVLRGLYGQYRLKQRHIAVGGMIVWFVSYHALTWWNQPIVADYRVLTLPPLVFFVALGMSFKSETGTLRKWFWPTLFLLLLLANNWILSIYPNYIYGKNRRDVYHLLRPRVNENDMFIASQWNIPKMPEIPSENIWGPASMILTDSEAKPEQGIEQMRHMIEAVLNDGRRIFVYGLVPGSYELRSMNRFRTDDNLYSATEFTELQNELMVDYEWHPVFMVLDIRNQANYQLGREWTTLWIVCPPPEIQSESACLDGFTPINQ